VRVCVGRVSLIYRSNERPLNVSLMRRVSLAPRVRGTIRVASLSAGLRHPEVPRPRTAAFHCFHCLSMLFFFPKGNPTA
jgi:hypothetical protein